MAISRFTVESYVQETAEYYRVRGNKKSRANSIEECNSIFRTTDGYLRTILYNLRKQISLERAPSFGIPFPNINVTPKGIMGKKCCLCPSNPVTHTQKNTIRDIGENYIKEWSHKAENYLNGGARKIDLGADKRKKVTTKNPFQ